MPKGSSDGWSETTMDVHVRYGRLAGALRSGRRQKGVDVQLAVDALNSAVDGVCDVAILVTGDADFALSSRRYGNAGLWSAYAHSKPRWPRSCADAPIESATCRGTQQHARDGRSRSRQPEV